MPKLPEFKSAEEFVDFIETHSLADYWDEFEVVEDMEIDRVQLRPARETVRIPQPLIAEIEQVAHQRGLSYQTLVQQWLAEKLVEAQRQPA